MTTSQEKRLYGLVCRESGFSVELSSDKITRRDVESWADSLAEERSKG